MIIHKNKAKKVKIRNQNLAERRKTPENDFKKGSIEFEHQSTS